MQNVTDCAIIKPHSLVFYKRFENKRYNEKSKTNLKQSIVPRMKTCKRISESQNFDDINNVFFAFNEAYKSNFKKDYDGLLSDNLKKKITKITSVFVNAILKNYQQVYGMQQRILTLSTYTLPTDKQNVTDKEAVKKFVDFIDHLKKVDNYIIEKGKLTNKKAPRLQNYFWRAETTENGVIHFHLITDCYLNMYMAKRLWNLQLQKMGFYPSQNSVRVESLDKNKIRDVHSYLLKYMTKEPLKDKYQFTKRQDLEHIPNIEKYRRPLMYKSWGCSRDLRKCHYPEFQENELFYVHEMEEHMDLVPLPETAPDFIKVLKGNTREILKKCSIKLQSWVKLHYKRIYQMLYNIPKEVKSLITDTKRIIQLQYFQTSFDF